MTDKEHITTDQEEIAAALEDMGWTGTGAAARAESIIKAVYRGRNKRAARIQEPQGKPMTVKQAIAVFENELGKWYHRPFAPQLQMALDTLNAAANPGDAFTIAEVEAAMKRLEFHQSHSDMLRNELTYYQQHPWKKGDAFRDSNGNVFVFDSFDSQGEPMWKKPGLSGIYGNRNTAKPLTPLVPEK